MKDPRRTTKRVRGLLLDIEGTTTPISFVHEVLFPFARTRVSSFLTAHWDSSEVISDVALLRGQHTTDREQGATPPPLIKAPNTAQIESITNYIHWLIDRDRKSTGLKSLQGQIWKQGYLDGTLRAPLFADVPPALARWQRAGLKVSIFSSGSVLAQQLLFAHTEAGDLTGFIDAYFDTTTGAKASPESYEKIAAALRLDASQVLFISDVVAELDAAHAAGMETLLCLRPGNHPQPASHHQTIDSFAGVPSDADLALSRA
jgi:enolase-phosphatase E1